MATTEHTAWAVVQHTEPYHPEGDPTRTATEFVHWIFATREAAARRKADLLIRTANFRVEVRQVPEESWDSKYGAKRKKEEAA